MSAESRIWTHGGLERFVVGLERERGAVVRACIGMAFAVLVTVSHLQVHAHQQLA